MIWPSLLAWVALIFARPSQSATCDQDLNNDVVFVVDSSGSVGEDAFNTGLDFIAEIIEEALTQTSRVGVIRFASQAVEIFSLEESEAFSSDQRQSEVENIYYTGGSTATVWAIVEARNMFVNQSSADRTKLMVLITDGDPNQSNNDDDVCARAESVKNKDIRVLLVGVGNFDSGKVDCLTTTDDDIFLVDDYDELEEILGDIVSVACPVEYSMQTTECKIDDPDDDDDDDRRRRLQAAGVIPNGTYSHWVETYNNGIDIKLHEVNVEGLFNGTLTRDTSLVLKAGQFMVIYDADAVDRPFCDSCGEVCHVVDGICNDTVLIPCCDGPSCSCNYAAGIYRMNNSWWEIKFIDNTNDYRIEALRYRLDDGWFAIVQGFSYELINLGYNNQDPANWASSCGYFGTPGAIATPCNWTCYDELCQLNGDSAGQCSVDGLSCNCGDGNGYYFGSRSCVRPPVPGDCVAFWTKQTNEDGDEYESVRFVWERANLDIDHTYKITYFVDNGGEETVETTERVKYANNYDYDRGLAQRAGYVRTVVSGAESDSVDCWSQTVSPTGSPTPNPENTDDDDLSINSGASKYAFALLKEYVYAIFTIIFGLATFLGGFGSARMHREGFFTDFMLFIVFTIDSGFYFLMSAVLIFAANWVDKQEFYLWGSLVPCLVHFILFGMIMVYYSKYFHRSRLMSMVAGNPEGGLKNVTSTWVIGGFVFTILVIIILSVINSVVTVVYFIDAVSFIGLLSTAFSLLIVLIDMCKRTSTKRDERSLLIFAFFSVLLLVAIFIMHLYVAMSYDDLYDSSVDGNRYEKGEDLITMRLVHLILETLLLVFVICLLSFIYQNLIFGTGAEFEFALVGHQDRMQRIETPVPQEGGRYSVTGGTTTPQTGPPTTEVAQYQSMPVQDPSARYMNSIGREFGPEAPPEPMRVEEILAPDDAPEDIGSKYQKGMKVMIWDPEKEEWVRATVEDVDSEGRILSVILDEDGSRRRIDLGVNPHHVEVYDSDHKMHVGPSMITRKKKKTNPYAALPAPENPHFGVPLNQVLASRMLGYDEPLPSILIWLISKLEEFHGYRAKGIFANGQPTNSESSGPNIFDEGVVPQAVVEEFQLVIEYDKTDEYDLGARKKYYVYVFSELIKKWFEELPFSILDGFDPANFEQASYKARVGAAISRFQEPQQSIFLLLLDVCNSVSENSDENGMTDKRLADIWSGRIYGLHNPSIRLSKIRPMIAKWFLTALKWRKADMMKTGTKSSRPSVKGTRRASGKGTPRKSPRRSSGTGKKKSPRRSSGAGGKKKSPRRSSGSKSPAAGKKKKSPKAGGAKKKKKSPKAAGAAYAE